MSGRAADAKPWQRSSTGRLNRTSAPGAGHALALESEDANVGGSPKGANIVAGAQKGAKMLPFQAPFRAPHSQLHVPGRDEQRVSAREPTVCGY